MGEPKPEELEVLVQELAEEYGDPEPIPQRVRVCPQCGAHNAESAWHCCECGETLSIETLTDKEAAQRSLEERRSAAQSAQQQPSLLAPSELVLLHGDRFANTSSAAVKFGKWVDLLHLDAAADARELGETMLAAAFLADEQAGAVQFEVRRQQALFGLLEVDKLYVVPGEHVVSWPRGSLESRLRNIAANLQSASGKGHNHVSEIVYDWWMGREGRKSSSPWARLGGLVKDGLAYRGLLQKERKSGLKGFLAGESYVLPAETAAMATEQSLEPVRELLETCRRTRPEVWDVLIEGINKGIGKCREQDWVVPT